MATTEKPKRVKLTTPEFRGSFVNLVKARAIEEGKEPKFSIMIVLPKGTPETTAFVAKLKKAIDDAYAAKHGKLVPAAVMKHYPIKDGATTGIEGMEKCICITAANKYKPGAIDKAGNKLIAEEDLYSGAWYRASVSAWAWAHATGGKGCSINLESVLKVKDDTRIGGGSNPDEDFASYIDKDGGAAEDAPTPDGDDAADLVGDEGDDAPPF
jgi:hypothetical protein